MAFHSAPSGLAFSISEAIAGVVNTITGTGHSLPSVCQQPQHGNTTDGRPITVADYADHSVPKLKVGGRVVDLFNGAHFDDLLRDTPDDIRPPSIILFHDSQDTSCQEKVKGMNYQHAAENKFPSRERLLIAEYDTYSAPKRAWYKFTPEMDLQARFNAKACPSLIFVPRKCNGWTEWCVQGKDPTDDNISIIGCKDFKEQCTGFVMYDAAKHGDDWVAWVKQRVEREGEPKISPFLQTYAEQNRWLREREGTTTNTFLRNAYLSHAFPAFTETGFKAMPTPKPVQEFLDKFLEKYKGHRKVEHWDAASTQVGAGVGVCWSDWVCLREGDG